MTRGSLVALAGSGAAIAGAAVVGVVLLVRGCGGGASGAPGAAGGPDPAARAGMGVGAMGAPGTAELRAAGCTDAIVVDLQRLLAAGGSQTGGGSGGVREGEPRYMVTCEVGVNEADAAGSPTCEKLAATYFRAVDGKADANVNIRVEVPGGARQVPVCSRLYAPSGLDLGPFPRAP